MAPNEKLVEKKFFEIKNVLSLERLSCVRIMKRWEMKRMGENELVSVRVVPSRC